MNFRQQVASGAAWVGASTIVVKMLSFITITLVLARVLEPADFGLVSIAWLAINALDFLRELGIASALIYRQQDEDGLAADVAYIALGISSIIIYAALFLLAPAIEGFFHDAAGVTSVLRVLALTTLINAIGQVPFTLLAKDLAFRNRAIPEIIGGAANSLLAIALALGGYGVWALVAGYLADALARNLLVWFFTAWRPRWRFDTRVWREMFAYGRHIVSSRLLIFGITNIDDLLVGRVLGTTPLGYYTLAYRISNVPATHVTRFFNNILFPAFSKLQDEPERLRRAFFYAIHSVGLVTIPLAVGVLALGPNFVHNYYLGKWDDAIVAMQWLAVYGLMRSVAAVVGNMYRSLGKPQWLTYLALWRFITMAVLLYPAIRWAGIVGVSVLSAVVAVVDFGIAAWLSERLLQGGYREYLRHLGPTLVLASVSALVAYLVLPLIPAPHRLLPFLVAGTIMVGLYALGSWWTDPVFRQVVLGALKRLGPAARLVARLGA
ncbi:MAG: lipopolysaccharide biosynthesis protein [Caldilineae bacterium]|nr:MAG: lipopolysaccharide biosynthesis protein [Caldilineae bacterium]